MNITALKVLERFRQKYPNLRVLSIVDYDQNHYVVEAVDKKNKVDYNDPFYGVHKVTGQISYFTPAFDPEKFIEACEKRTLYRSGG